MAGCIVCGSPLNKGAKKYCSWLCYRAVQRSTPVWDRFWAKVRKSDGCWLWTGGRLGQNGYGQFGMRRADGKHYPHYAHRVAWELVNGPIPQGQWVLHHCDVQLCVRPDHLFLGTQFHNMQDASAKGRLNVPRPTRRKLTDDEREDVRREYAAGGVTLGQLAAQRGVTKAFIWQIVHRRGSSAIARRTA